MKNLRIQLLLWKTLRPGLLVVLALAGFAFSHHHVNLKDGTASPAVISGVRTGDTITWASHDGEFVLTFADGSTAVSSGGEITVSATSGLYGPYRFTHTSPGYVGNGGGEVHPLHGD